MDGDGILDEAVGRLARRPATPVLEGLRQVPVVEREPRRDVVREERVHEPLVEVEPRGVDGSAVGTHPRPRGGEAVGLQAELCHEGDVRGIPVIVVARDVTGVATDDRARGVREGVPDGVAAPVLVARPLDLVGGGRGADDEAGRHRPRRGEEEVGRHRGGLPRGRGADDLGG